MSELFERTWEASGAKAAVVLVHGLGEHSGRYEHVAQALNAAGYSVYAQDLRGHGRSVGAPGDMGQDIEQIVVDIVELCGRIAQSHEKVYVLAHSMGTLFSLPAVAKMPSGTVAGLVLSGTAIEPGAAAADLVTNGAVPPETLSRDESVVKAYVDDPLVWDSVPPEVMGHALEAGQRAREAVPLIDIPVLLVHGSEDRLCDIAGSNFVHAELVTTDKSLIGYEGLYHEILNEPERDRVIADIVAWLDERC